MHKLLWSWAAFALASAVVPSLPAYGECQASTVLPVLTLPVLTLPPLQATSPAVSSPSLAVPSWRKAVDLGQFKVTFYWLVEEDAYSGRKTSPLYGTDGKLVGRFTPQFVRDFRTESCAQLGDGTIISYMKRANRCQVVDEPIGVNGFTLKELKSVAVDPSVIPVGSRLYIPEAEGVTFSDSSCHNGVFYAHDIGGAIKGNRIDIYLGPKSNLDFFRSTALYGPGYVRVYLLQ